MENKIYVLIIIYNKSCNDSISYTCLKEIENLNIIVCDNSTADFGNEALVNNDENIYINMNGNQGLSKAYNRVLEYLKACNSVVCLFDDDTQIPKGYFDELDLLLESQEWDICLPQVLCKNGLMSPVQLKKYSVKKINNLASFDKQYIAGINSGMAIKLSLLKNYNYDENIFLDFVDYNFILEMRKKNAKIIVMNTQLHQSFSNENNSKESAKIRYKIKKKDLRYFYRGSFISRLFFVYLISKLKANLFLKFKDLSVLFW